MRRSARPSASFVATLLCALLLCGDGDLLQAQEDVVVEEEIDDTVADADTTDATDTLPDLADIADTAAADDGDAGLVVAGPLRFDSTEVTARPLAASTLGDYLDDDAFNYVATREEPPSFIEAIFNWFGELIAGLLMNEVTGELLPYVLLAVAIGLLLYFGLKGEARGLTTRSVETRESVEYTEEIDDLFAIDFDAQIAAALAAGNHRRALRFRYLKVLRALTDRELIRWRPEKTNSDYIRELADADHRRRFADLTRLFEYVWYGDMPIDAGGYTAFARDADSFLAGPPRSVPPSGGDTRAPGARGGGSAREEATP